MGITGGYAIMMKMKEKVNGREKGRFTAFKLDRRAIDLMLNLRRNGWSQNALSSFFGVDKDTIQYHCRKYGIVFIGCSIGIPPVKEIEDIHWKYIDGEKVNKGKSYKEYIKGSQHRPPSKIRASSHTEMNGSRNSQKQRPGTRHLRRLER